MGIRLITSTPQARATSTTPEPTSDDARLVACWLDPHWVSIVVAAVVSTAVAIPATREFFLSDRYDDTSEALLAAFVIIPLQTVLPEEVLFRGVLQGVLGRLFTPLTTLVVGAIAFGLWHILSSTGLTAGNEGLSGVLGAGTVAQLSLIHI